MIEALVVLLALTGSLLNARKRVEGFYFWIAANALACFMFYAVNLYLMMALYIIYIVVAIYGICFWKTHE